jgi:Uma2 family endonuclease
MANAFARPKLRLGPKAAGILLTPEEFDLIEDYNENYRYELVHGVLVVLPIPGAQETGPNELLGYYLLSYQQHHDEGAAMADTLPQQYVRTATGRRLADRLIWVGLGRLADPKEDAPSIAVELVSAGRRNRERDYVDKRKDYAKAKLKEYWIIDRFRRIMTVIRYTGRGQQVQVVAENQAYRTPLLPGFKLPPAQILQAADQRSRKARRS